MPEASNRVTPAWDHPDPIGIPRPRNEYKLDAFIRRGPQAVQAMHDPSFHAAGVSFRRHSKAFLGRAAS